MSQASANSAASFGPDHITTVESPLWAVLALVVVLFVGVLIWRTK